jgi:hypothetical protein
MVSVRPRHDTTPDVVEIILYYWDTCRWIINEEKPKSIRFHIIGKAMGPFRWRPHLVQYRDPLPIQGKKDLSVMLDTLKTSISTNLNLECAPITKDLLDDISGVRE